MIQETTHSEKLLRVLYNDYSSYSIFGASVMGSKAINILNTSDVRAALGYWLTSIYCNPSHHAWGARSKPKALKKIRSSSLQQKVTLHAFRGSVKTTD